MKYYSEEEMGTIRLAMEEMVLHWQDTTTKRMFGSPCFLVHNTLFAILVTRGVVLTKLDLTDREILIDRYEAAPFVEGKKIIQKWVRVPLETEQDLDTMEPFIRKRYESARSP